MCNSKEQILQPGEYKIPLENGCYLSVMVSADSNYPGVDVEFCSAEHDRELEDGKRVSNPRVVVEFPKDEPLTMKTLVWGDCRSEEPTDIMRTYTEISGPGLNV